MKRIFTSDMMMQRLEYSQLVLSLALVQYFLTMFPSLHFGTIMYILFRFMLEAYDLVFDFGFIGDYS